MYNVYMDFVKIISVVLLLMASLGALFYCKGKNNRNDRSVKRKAKKVIESMEDMMCEFRDLIQKRD